MQPGDRLANFGAGVDSTVQLPNQADGYRHWQYDSHQCHDQLTKADRRLRVGERWLHVWTTSHCPVGPNARCGLRYGGPMNDGDQSARGPLAITLAGRSGDIHLGPDSAHSLSPITGQFNVTPGVSSQGKSSAEKAVGQNERGAHSSIKIARAEHRCLLGSEPSANIRAIRLPSRRHPRQPEPDQVSHRGGELHRCGDLAYEAAILF